MVVKQTSSADSGAAVDHDRRYFEGIFVRGRRRTIRRDQLAADFSVASVHVVLEIEEHFWAFRDVKIGPLIK